MHPASPIPTTPPRRALSPGSPGDERAACVGRRRLRVIAASFLLGTGGMWFSGCHGLHKALSSPTTGTVASTGSQPASKLSATARVGPALPVAGTDPAVPTAAMRRSAKETRVGEVRVIGGGRRFVLIEVAPKPDVPLLSTGLELRSRAPVGSAAYGGEETAVLRVSPERRQPFIVADVISGEPHVDDPVFYSPGSAVLPSFLPAILQEPTAQPVQPQQPNAQPQMTAPTPDSTPRYRATATVHPMGE